MSSTQTITKNPLEHPSMDYAAMRAEGIRLLERVAGPAWTDFNAHDPGITILEAACYAITELGYRIEHPMPDLLAGDGDPYGSLYGPSRVLPTEPVTLFDLRRLILDVDGVRNAWVEPIDAPSPALVYHEGEQALRIASQTAGSPIDRYATPVALRGLYRVRLTCSSFADIDSNVVRRNVVLKLQAHRPLCADFAEIRVLETEAVKVHTRIEIANALDPAALLGTIYDAISAHIAPTTRFSTLPEMLVAGKTIDAIFEGPRLEHGFLDSTELERLEKRAALHTSDLLREIMDIPGVRAVHELSLSSPHSNAGKSEPWTLPLAPERAPGFDLQASTITLLRDGIEIILDRHAMIEAHIARKKAAAIPRAMTAADLDRLAPQGRNRNVDAYTSLLHLLPDCYGAGALGLPDSASPERKAQQKQLRAYLQFFDQILRNAFAQLGHAKTLLSYQADICNSYAAQIVDDAAIDLDAVRTQDRAAHASWLETTLQNPAHSRSSIERANQFLDHLLARFGESHAEYTPNLSSGQKRREAIARDKQAFLQQYPRLSTARATAIDYTLPRGSENRCGLAERIERALGLDVAREEGFLVIEHLLLRPIEEDKNQLGENEIRPIPLLAASKERDPYSHKLSFVFPSWPIRFNETAFRKLVEQTIRNETPAHLVPYVYWLSRTDYPIVEAAYDDWLSWYRTYSREKLGL